MSCVILLLIWVIMVIYINMLYGGMTLNIVNYSMSFYETLYYYLLEMCSLNLNIHQYTIVGAIKYA